MSKFNSELTTALKRIFQYGGLLAFVTLATTTKREGPNSERIVELSLVSIFQLLCHHPNPSKDSVLSDDSFIAALPSFLAPATNLVLIRKKSAVQLLTSNLLQEIAKIALAIVRMLSDIPRFSSIASSVVPPLGLNDNVLLELILIFFFQTLVGFLSASDNNDRKAASLQTLVNLSSNKINRRVIVEATGLEVIQNILTSTDQNIQMFKV